MNLLREKTNLTILFSSLFILGVISFFAQIQLFSIFLVSIILIFAIYSNKIKTGLAFILFLAFVSGYCLSDFRVKESDTLFHLAPRNDITIEGQVNSILETNKSDRTRFYFVVNNITNNGEKINNIKSKTIVTLFEPKENYTKIQIGDTLKLTGNLRIPQQAANPNEFSYKNYLHNSNTFSTFYVDKGNYEIIQNPDKLGVKFLQKLNIQRAKIINTHEKFIKSPYIELLGGIVFGDDAINPTDELKKSFKISGLLHLLAASGLNVGLIFGIWFCIGKFLRLNYKINTITGAVLILIYTCMTGFSPSIIRATLMIEFVLLGKLIDRSSNTLALISFVCFLMLLYNPAWICHIGFQLSFLVTIGLIITMPIVSNWCSQFNKFLQTLINISFVPFIAQLWVIPLQMFYFNTFSLYSTPTNILVLPFITIVSFIGFVSSILASFSFIPDFVIKIFDVILSPFLTITVKISDFISTLPNANITTIQPNIYQVIFYYIIITFITYFISSEKKNKKALYFIIISVIIFFLSFIKIPDKQLSLTFFAVKNADSCLIKTPKNHYFIIDTGKKSFSGSYSNGEGIIAKYLLSKGIRKIDYVILTHLDNDHIGGTIGLLDKIKVKKVFINDNTAKTQTSYELFKYLNKNKIPYEIVKNNSVLHQEKDFTLKAYLNKSIDTNENSIINLISYKDFNALFMGDAGADGYNILPQKRINVLKLGHHGAQHTINEDVIQNFTPETIIISTGQNQYGHPHHDIINLLNKHNIRYLRTDEKNAINITTNGILDKNNSIKEEKCYFPEKRKFKNCN